MLAALLVCVAAAAAIVSTLASSGPEATPASEPAQAPPAVDGDASFARDWQRALARPSGDSALWEVAARWLDWTPQAVMDAVAALDGHAERKALALSLWLEAAPADALAWARGSAERARLRVAAIAALAGRDPVGAVAAAERLEGMDRVVAAKAALRVWAGADPMAAWRAAQAVSVAFNPWWSPPGLLELAQRPARRQMLSLAVLDVWAKAGSLREPLDAVVSTPDANVPSRWVDAALGRWAAAAPQDALAWASSLPPRTEGPPPLLRVEALGATLASMAVHWPHLANQAMEAIGDWQNRERNRIYNTVGYRETIRDYADTAAPRRVAAWFENHPDESLRQRHADDVARAYARAHPQEAVAWARALPPGWQRENAVWGALNVVTGEAPERIAAMLLDFGDADLLAQVSGRLSRAWAKVDPVAVLRWKADHLPAMSTSGRMATFNVWATYDPPAAAAHLDTLADPDERAWAAWHVIHGMFFGKTNREDIFDDVPMNIAEHIPMIERLYAGLPQLRRSKHVAYFLYRHFEHSDPVRAARYKAYYLYRRFENSDPVLAARYKAEAGDD